MSHMLNGYGMTMGISGVLFMALIWVFVIAVAIYLLRLLIKGNSPTEYGENALEILKKRYAQGELTEEQFNKIRHNLEQLEPNI